MRFALSLKRSADPDGGEEWQLKHFSSAKFASDPSPGTQMSAAHDDIGIDSLDPSNGRVQSTRTARRSSVSKASDALGRGEFLA